MSEAKHTPGPWGIREDIPYSPAGWVVFHGYHEENKTVCRLSHGSNVPPVHDEAYLENKSNAQLIAASPDLLEALEDLAYDHPSALQPGKPPPIVAALKAIAKAKGEPRLP